MVDPHLLASIGLEFYLEGPAIICRPCRFAVAVAAADKLHNHDHLRDRHHLYTADHKLLKNTGLHP
jgi:hypothetical protein